MDKISAYLQEVRQSLHFGWIALAILAIEVLSFAGFAFPVFQHVVFFLILFAALLLTLKNLHYGILIVLAELCIGSKGYLFAVPLGGMNLSIRLGVFMVIFFCYGIWIIRDRSIAFFHWPLRYPYLLLIGVILVSPLIGWLHGNSLSNIFFDANGYLYFGLILPLTQAVKTRQQLNQLFALVVIAATVVTIETLGLLFLFSHIKNFPQSWYVIYRWIRETGVGEVTIYGSGFPRIFFQSHLYQVMLFFFVGFLFTHVAAVRARFSRYPLAITAGSLMILFLSYSRSFWVATVVGLSVAMLWLLVKEKIGLARVARILVVFFMLFVADFIIAYGIVNIPLTGSSGVNASSLLTQRTKDISTEPAAASRWQLLKPLSAKALEHPVFGSGLGSTLTYHTADPKVLEKNPNGEYTTYAFEWGYLDLAFKFGFIGILMIGYFFITLIRFGLRSMTAENQYATVIAGLLLSLVVLLGIHFFTPYLNHPLGIGWILLISIALPIFGTTVDSPKRRS